MADHGTNNQPAGRRSATSRGRRRLGRDRLARHQRPARRRGGDARGGAAPRPGAQLHAPTASARALSVGRTGLVGFTVPNVHAEYFAVDPLRGHRGALRAGHARRPLPDAAPARARGHAARPPDARDDRRRDPAAPDGDERRAEGAPGARLPLRRRRPSRPARRGHPGRLGRALGRREGGDRPSPLARPPPDRLDHRPARLGRERGALDGYQPRWPRPACCRRRSSSPRATS